MSNEEKPRGTHHASRITAWWLVVAAVAAWLLWMTLRSQEQASADLMPITVPAAAQRISIPFLIDFLGNIVVFIPLGAAAAFALDPVAGIYGYRRGVERSYRTAATRHPQPLHGFRRLAAQHRRDVRWCIDCSDNQASALSDFRFGDFDNLTIRQTTIRLKGRTYD